MNCEGGSVSSIPGTLWRRMVRPRGAAAAGGVAGAVRLRNRNRS